MEDAQAVGRIEVATTDVVVAHELIRDTYAGHRLVIRNPRGPFRYRQTTAISGDLAVDSLLHTLDVHEDVEPVHDIRVGLVTAGRIGVARPGEEVRVAPGEVLLFPQGTRFSCEWRLMDLRMVRLPTEIVARRAGIDPAHFRFTGMAPVSAALAAHCRTTVQYLHSLFAGAEPAAGNELVRAGALDAMAAVVLATFPGAHREGGDGGRTLPAAVRRAVAHMDAHAAEPLSLADIAAAAGVGVRALQEAFRRHRDTTPTAYLRQVRLDRAHRELQAADPARGDTVAAMAARWGFAHPGRFAAAYRKAYGRAPQQTLLG